MCLALINSDFDNSIPVPTCHALKQKIAMTTMMARRLRNNQDLARFVIGGEANGRQLGIGSYGSVEEVSMLVECNVKSQPILLHVLHVTSYMHAAMQYMCKVQALCREL